MKIISCLILFLFPSFLIAQEIQIEPVQMETIATFSFGYGDFELQFVVQSVGNDPEGPTDILITDDDYYLWDYWNNQRFVKISKDLSSFETINQNYNFSVTHNRLMKSGKYILSTDNNAAHVQVVDLEQNDIVFNISTIIHDDQYFFNKGLYSYGFYILEHFLIGESRKDLFFIIDIDTQNYLEMNGNDATKYFSENSSNIKIVDNDFVFYKNNFITSSAFKFYQYIQRYNEKFASYSEKLDSFKSSDRVSFCGQDYHGFSYWSRGNSLYIFDNDGTWIKKLGVDASIRTHSPMTRFSIDSEGNLYRLIANENSYDLKRIKRYW